MWANDFDDFGMDFKRKRRKIDNAGSYRHGVLPASQPKSVEELATHSRKIGEVRGWLEAAGKSDMLLITGPTGCAKTTTLKLVAKKLNIHVQEWVNPSEKMEFFDSELLESVNVYDSSAYHEPKQAEKFEGFALRSSRYSAIGPTSSNRIILIEDFPNYFIWKPSQFFDFLTKYRTMGLCPIVFVCTDDAKLNLSNSLFPSHIRDSFCIANIKFNPVSPSGLLKALQRCVTNLPKDKLQEIAKACQGDIRTALCSAEFLLAGSPRAGSEFVSSAVSKDNPCEFFHTLGRVLYPKKRDSPSQEARLFFHDVFTIADQYDSKFLSMLHENFLKTFSSVNETAVGCALLSDCDLLHCHEELQMYAGIISVIGLMSANKQPKKKTFMPMTHSKFRKFEFEKVGGSQRTHPSFMVSNRVITLEVLPYLKILPDWAMKISQRDVDRLPTSTCGKDKNLSLFKKPLPPQTKAALNQDVDDEMVIEEYDD